MPAVVIAAANLMPALQERLAGEGKLDLRAELFECVGVGVGSCAIACRAPAMTWLKQRSWMRYNSSVFPVT